MTLKELIKEGENLIQDPIYDNGDPKYINVPKREPFIFWERKARMFLQHTYKSNPQVAILS